MRCCREQALALVGHGLGGQDQERGAAIPVFSWHVDGRPEPCGSPEDRVAPEEIGVAPVRVEIAGDERIGRAENHLLKGHAAPAVNADFALQVGKAGSFNGDVHEGASSCPAAIGTIVDNARKGCRFVPRQPLKPPVHVRKNGLAAPGLLQRTGNTAGQVFHIGPRIGKGQGENCDVRLGQRFGGVGIEVVAGQEHLRAAGDNFFGAPPCHRQTFGPGGIVGEGACRLIGDGHDLVAVGQH